MQLSLRRRTHLTGNVWAYEFEPPRPITWTAGQFVQLDLPHPAPDEAGTRRYFTIASAPHEGIIRIATRHTGSPFKQALHALQPGGQIKLLDLPAGNFVWQDQPQPLVFVAQGIGITPFYAMLLHRAHHGLPLRTQLLYANRTSNVPFLPQLEHWRRQGLELTLSDEPFTAARIAAEVPDLHRRLVYVSGPKSLVALLGPPYNLPASQLKTDVFPNYSASQY